eukprot:NODE_6401_length_1675_cov_4.518734.p1 GENE.NODE_6401_length_1675_cov_4.518734~~NODE_6401_length_1675_cov_4.518734.p1  ORF type:complete len:407 (+),score=110.95 NODE_6401_length_1675_cov_4.518734:122-1342(+)
MSSARFDAIIANATRADCGKDPTTGSMTVNQYRFIHDVGHGTFSSVKWAVDGDGRGHAVKVLSRAVLERRFVAKFDADGATTVPLREKIEGELHILSLLSHPNIIALEEVLQAPDGERLFVVFEGAEGGQLLRWEEDLHAYSAFAMPENIKRLWGDGVLCGNSGARLDRAEVVVYQEVAARHIFRQIVACTAYLHERKVIHKDLKPDNILLMRPLPVGDPRFARLLSLDEWPSAPTPREVGGATEGWQDIGTLLSASGWVAKVADFNTAVICEDAACVIFDAEGTTQFTPQECFISTIDGVPGKPRDVWSLGAVLFTMLFGRCPFWEEENINLQLAIMQGDGFDFPSGVVSLAATDLFRALLQHDANARPSAAQALQHSWMCGARAAPALSTTSSGGGAAMGESET